MQRFLLGLLLFGACLHQASAHAQAISTQWFEFGAACNGTDCLSGEAHVMANGVTLPNNVAGLCFNSMTNAQQSPSPPNLIDIYNEWYAWNGTTFTAIARPSGAVSCPSPYSADKTIITAPNGSLVNATGTWTWNNGCGQGIYVVTVNGVVANICGSKMTIDNDGIIYDFNVTWWKYNPSNKTWTNTGTTTTP